jgi:hypothetical protein
MRILSFTISAVFILGAFYNVIVKTEKLDCLNHAFYLKAHNKLNKTVENRSHLGLSKCHFQTKIIWQLKGRVDNE